jgi:hypothetical protein
MDQMSPPYGVRQLKVSEILVQFLPRYFSYSQLRYIDRLLKKWIRARIYCLIHIPRQISYYCMLFYI